jgi:pimeloyl-ACP methyl ester carboxylesterase
MPKISIGDAELYYEAHGDGPPLLLVPGLSGSARSGPARFPTSPATSA